MLTKKKIAIASIETIVRQLISIGSLILMARILSAEDYGDIAPLYIVISIATGIIDFGIGSAIVRYKNIGLAGESTAFWINLTISMIIILILSISAEMISLYFKNENLKTYLYIVSLSIFIASLGAIQQNILLRDQKFELILIINIISILIGTLIAVIMAYIGYGSLSLVLQILITNVSLTVLVWVTSDWRPLFTFDKLVFRRLIEFGFFLTLSGIINAIYKNIGSSLILKTVALNRLDIFIMLKRYNSTSPI